MRNKRLDGFRNGYRSGFEFYQNKFEDRLFIFLCLLSGDEWMAQQGVSHAFIRLGDVRHKMNDEEQIERFLFRVARNYCSHYNREEGDVAPAELELAMILQDEIPDDDPMMNIKKAIAEVLKAKDGLPPRRKRVVEMYFFEDLSTGEIAKRLNTAEQKVQEILNSSMEILRRQIRFKM